MSEFGADFNAIMAASQITPEGMRAAVSEEITGPRVDALYVTVAALNAEHTVYLQPTNKYGGDEATVVDVPSGETLTIRRTSSYLKIASDASTLFRGLKRLRAWATGKPAEPPSVPDTFYDYSITLADPSRPDDNTFIWLHAAQEDTPATFAASHNPPVRSAQLLGEDLEVMLTTTEGLLTSGIVRTREQHDLLESLKPQSRLSADQSWAIANCLVQVFEAEGLSLSMRQAPHRTVTLEALGADHNQPFAIEKVSVTPFTAPQEQGYESRIRVHIHFANSRLRLSATLSAQGGSGSGPVRPIRIRQAQAEDKAGDPSAKCDDVKFDPGVRQQIVAAVTSQLVPGNLIRWSTEA